MRRTISDLIQGFTLVEVLVVVGLIVGLLSITIVSLPGAQRRAYLTAATSTLIADMKSQQMKAMFGETEGRSSHDAYGVYMESTRYILFHGPTYDPSASSNIIINLDNHIQLFSIMFPQSQVIFGSGSGEIASFTPGSSSVTVRNTLNNEQKTITVNRYGVITGIN